MFLLIFFLIKSLKTFPLASSYTQYLLFVDIVFAKSVWIRNKSEILLEKQCNV